MIRIFVAFLCVVPTIAFSLPENESVNSGQVSFQQNNNVLNINQQSDLASINYDSFNIQSNEIVNFIQPNAGSIALNRVIGNNPSQIFGQLNANGQVFLVNPNGILFGVGSSINVGGLFATTLNIKDSDFINRRYSFESLGGSGAIDNFGDIRGNYIAMVSPVINNYGDISAGYGEVNLHAADAVEVSFSDGINIETTQSSYDAVINNYGYISADGGNIIINASARNELIETVINNEGEIRAGSVQQSNGRIFLVADQQGDVVNNGTVTTSAIESNVNGGEVLLQASRVAQMGTIQSDGMGQGDGGQVNLTSRNVTSLNESSLTTANAGEQGDGGNVIAFSPEMTLFRDNAIIEAKGGSIWGDGGYVDVSGYQHVEAFGVVNVSASDGNHGTFLIDPTDITIAAIDSGISAGPIFQATAAGATLNITTLSTALETGAAVEVRTDTGFNAGESGDIIINPVAINFDSNDDGTSVGSSLLLFADRDIIFSAGSSIRDSVGADASLPITLTAGRDITFFDNTLIQTNGGNFSATAGGLFRVDPSSTGGNSLIDSGSGTLSITTGGNARLGGLLSTNATTSAITLNIAGDITDGGATYTDIVAASGRTTITAGGVNNIETDLNDLAFTFSGLNPSTLTNATALNIVSGASIANLSLVTTTGNLTLSGNIDANGGNGNSYSFNANQDLIIGAGVTVGDLTAADDDVNMTLVAGNNLSMADGSLVDAVGGLVNVTTTVDATVSSLSTTNTSASAITMNVGGNLNDSGDTILRDLDAQNGGANLVVGGSIAATPSLEVDVNQLSLSLSGGNANITEISNVNLTSVSGVAALNLNSGGDVTLSGDIDLDGSNGNTYSITAAQDININAGVNITDLTPVSTDDVGITLTANRNITMADTSVIDASAGLITLTADNDSDRVGNITLADVITTSAAANAISISAEDIIDGTVDTLDIQAVNGQLNLVATGNINGGFGADIDIDVNAVDVTTVNGGSVGLRQDSLNDLIIASENNVTNLALSVPNASISISNSPGINIPGLLSINTQEVTDPVPDNTVSLFAPQLEFSLTALTSDVQVDTNATQLDVQAAGAGNVTISSNGPVAITDIGTASNPFENLGGNITLTNSAGDISVASSIDLDGMNGRTLTLNAFNDLLFLASTTIDDQNIVSTDDVNIVFTAGNNLTMNSSNAVDSGTGTIAITTGGDASLFSVTSTSASTSAISVNANDIFNGGTGTDLSAVNGGISLTASGNIQDGPVNNFDINTQQLSVNMTGGGNANIQEVDDLTITAITGAADVRINSSAGVITIPNAGLSVTGNASITATDMVDAGASPRDLVLAAQALSLNLSAPAGDVSLTSTINSLDATLGGANRNLVVSETDSVSILGATGINDLTLNATSGAVTIPDAGLSITGNLIVNSQDIFDTDRTINIAAVDTVLNLTAAANDVSINTNINRLDASVVGGSLSILETSGLQIENFDALNATAINVADGNFSAQVSAGNLIINDTVQAQDVTADGIRKGMIDLRVDAGDLLIGNIGGTVIQSINTVDQNALGGLNGNQESIRLNNPSLGDINSNIVIGDSIGNDVQITAQGGDILLENETTQNLTAGNTRDITINSDVTIDAYNLITDPLSGSVNIDASVINNGASNIRNGRTLIAESAQVGSPVIPIIPVDDATNIVTSTSQEQDQQSGSSDSPQSEPVSDSQMVFDDVFTACGSGGESETSKECEQDKAMRNFLNTLLIGGNLPEIGTDEN